MFSRTAGVVMFVFTAARAAAYGLRDDIVGLGGRTPDEAYQGIETGTGLAA